MTELKIHYKLNITNMANNKKKSKASGGGKSKGRVRLNVPRAGVKDNGSILCGGGRKKANGGKKC